MLKIDRRAIVTGLAALAASATVPDLPASAAPHRRVAFTSGRTYRSFRRTEETAAAARLLPNSRWLYDLGLNCSPTATRRFSIRHLATGLTFSEAHPDCPGCPRVNLAYIETSAAVLPSPDEIHAVGYAAYETVAAVQALEHDRDKSFASNTGAILIQFADCVLTDPLEIIWPLSFEDAPPLPRIVA